jgi:electron transport complex protein RnfB
MAENVYESLRERLDRHPSGCPPAGEITEILKILFSEKEAKVALALGFRPYAVDLVAAKVGLDLEETHKHLEALADRGVVFAKQKNDTYHYALLPILPGLFEFPFMKGERNPTLERLSHLWQTYLKKIGKELGSPSMAFARVITIQEPIANEPEVLPYERLYELIDQAKVLGIAHCACRESSQNCEAPREACMLFGDTCTYLVERGFARYITKEEMKEKLREFDAAGLVHQTNNSRDRLTFICNCCPCCCHLLRFLTELKNPHVLTSSGFIPQNNLELCSGCGICADERCPMGAIRMEEAEPAMETELCIGCGLCVTGCPEGALELIRREAVPTPAPTARHMGFQILKDKGKLQGFLPLISPPSDTQKD